MAVCGTASGQRGATAAHTSGRVSASQSAPLPPIEPGDSSDDPWKKGQTAPDPIKEAYVGYYRPESQNVQFGVQTRFLDDMYTARLFGDVSTLYQRFGGRLTRTFNVSNDVAVDVWGGLGATHWIQTLGGRWDPVVFAGINVVLGGRYMNSTNTIRYEHLQSGGEHVRRMLRRAYLPVDIVRQQPDLHQDLGIVGDGVGIPMPQRVEHVQRAPECIEI